MTIFLIIFCIYLIYCAIGCVVNGLLNEKLQLFSFMLMLFWPVALVMILVSMFMEFFVGIGAWIKKTFDL